MSHKTAILSSSNHHFISTIFVCPRLKKKASVKCSGRFIITEIANASDAVDTNEKTENRITKTPQKRAKKTKNRITKLNTETHELKVFPLKILLVLCERNLSPGGLL